MKVGLLLIGDELLSGKIKDKNGHLVAQTCFARGLELHEIRVVPDQVATIASVIETMSGQWDVVITSGGIGPTHDDKTFEALSQAFAQPLETHEPTRQKLEGYLSSRGQVLNNARMKMVRFPKGAVVEGFPDVWLPLVSFKNIFILPGVPSLFAMLLPPVFQRFSGTPKKLVELGTQMPEGDLAEDLSRALEKWPEIDIGSYPQERGNAFRVKICLESINQQALEEAVHWLCETLQAKKL
ncbi:MAG: hypothetical protein CMH56_10400 [Myxococcales bacterium]|nr:hypothetical protein [Myxococcales bacterium]